MNGKLTYSIFHCNFHLKISDSSTGLDLLKMHWHMSYHGKSIKYLCYSYLLNSSSDKSQNTYNLREMLIDILQQ